jgi:hypothetical protein
LQRQLQSGGNSVAPAPEGNSAAPAPAAR